MWEANTSAYMVWLKREYDSFPIEPFNTKEEADKKAQELNKKEKTDKYYVSLTHIRYGITI